MKSIASGRAFPVSKQRDPAPHYRRHPEIQQDGALEQQAIRHGKENDGFNDEGRTSGSGGAQTDTDTLAITVNPVNDAPINTVPGPQATFRNQPMVFSTANGTLISVVVICTEAAPL